MDIKRKDWAEYQEKLFPIIKQTERRNDHIFADEIDKALSEDRAFLFIGDDGFFVLEPLSRNGIVRVNVMFAFNWGANAIDRYQSTIERLAREIGARSIELYTVVKGLIPLLESNNWSMDTDGRVMHWVKIL